MKKQFRDFKKARKFVHSLKLKNDAEWREFSISDQRPADIPSAPNVTYKSEWKGLGDWLGTGTISPSEKSKKYLPFPKAREFVHLLKFKNKQEWEDFSKSGKKPDDIPTAPWESYKNKGWISMDDFLGHGRISNTAKKFQSYDYVCAFARKLALKSSNEWRVYCKSGKKPDDIPHNPNRIYQNKGWTTWGDFFGTGIIAGTKLEYWSFPKARKFVLDRGLKSRAEWDIFRKSDKMPKEIPGSPERVYKEEWNGIGDWLGTGIIAFQNRKWLSWNKAKLEYKKLAKENNIKTLDQWRKFLRTYKLPQNLPSRPDYVYSKERIGRIMK